ncbi:MAG: hypothetical protein AB7F86_07445 [Bdellovibrionales bacterium]
MKKIIASTLLLAISGTAIAAESLSTKIDDVDPVPSQRTFKPSITSQIGSSSNVGRLNKATSGSFFFISPGLTYEPSISENTVLNIEVRAETKTFSTKGAETLGNEKNLELRNTLIWFASDSWETGGDLGGVLGESRIPVQLDSSTTTAQMQRFNELNGRVYLAYFAESSSVEIGTEGRRRDYSTPLDDRGNRYEGDYSSLSGDLQYTKDFSESTKASIKYLYEDKHYGARPADFSDGAASAAATPHPKLREVANELGLALAYSFGKISLSTAPSYRVNKDKIFGARDSNTQKIVQKISIPISESLSWSPSITYSTEIFKSFRSAPESDPVNSPLREDSNLKLSGPLKYKLKTDLELSGDYSYSKKSSNYANSSYEDQSISLGLSLTM